MLIRDKNILSTLDDSDAQFVAYLTLFNKPYNNMNEYTFRKSQYKKNTIEIARLTDRSS